MGVSMEQLVETQLKVIDAATGPLTKIGKAAEKTSGLFEKLEGGLHALLPVAGSLGAAFGMHQLISNTEEYLKRIKEVKDLTGATAGETDLLFSSARKAGVGYDEMQRVMFQLSRRGSMLEQTMAASAGKVPGMADKFKRLGVTMDKGPVKAITTMSKAVKNGKLDAGELMSQFRIPPGQVNDFKEFLENLDEKKIAAAAKGGVGLVSDDDIDSFDRMEKAQHRMSDAWTRMQVMVGRRLIPVMADLVEKVADKLENEWLPAAVRFGEFLGKHMTEIVGLAKTFVAVMTAKKLLNVLESVTSPAGLIGKLAAGGIGGGASGALGGIGAMVGQVGTIVSGFMAAIPALLGIGAAVGVIYLGYQRIQANVDGIKDRLLNLWDSIRARFELLGETVTGIWNSISGIFGEGGTFTEFIGKLAGIGFEYLVTAADHFVHAIQTAVSFFTELGENFNWLMKDVFGENWLHELIVDPFLSSMKVVGSAISTIIDFVIDKANMLGKYIGVEIKKENSMLNLLEAPFKMISRHWDKTQKATEGRAAQLKAERMAESTQTHRRDAPEKRPPPNQYDFRGSRFDITQKFAEGFDPDRIAVAFANDLASLGEMKSQSGFAPVFGAR